LIKWVIPTGIFSLYLRARFRGKKGMWGPLDGPGTQVRLNSANQATLFQLRKAVRGEIVWISVDKVRTDMAKALTPQQHPYVRFFAEGKACLEEFFKLNHPRNSLESVFVFGSREDVGAIPEKSRRDARGNQLYRKLPWSSETLAESQWIGGSVGWEIEQLERIKRSVTKKGLWIEQNALEPGFWLFVNDETGGLEDFRVVLWGGNHRVAVLAYLQWPLIPMSPSGRTEVRLSDLETWPGVIDGSFTKEEARICFMAFFRSPDEGLLPGW